MSATRSLRFIAFGCRHAPLSDAKAIQWVLDEVRKYKPDVILDLGDGVEGNAASKWDDAKEMDIALEDEFKADEEFMRAIRLARPQAKRIRLCANHEANLLAPGRIDPRIRSLCDWSRGPEYQHWTVVKEYVYCKSRGCYWPFQQICGAHGFETTPSRMTKEVLYFTESSPNSLFLSAHTHRPHEVRQIMLGDLAMNRWHANVGCLRDLSPQFMDRKPKWAWGHGMVVGESRVLKSPRKTREWDAQTKILCMYDEWAATNKGVVCGRSS